MLLFAHNHGLATVTPTCGTSNGDELGGEWLEHDDSHLYAIGAGVMLSA